MAPNERTQISSRDLSLQRSITRLFDSAFETRPWSRETFWGSFIFNLATFLLPAIYSTLSKLWIAGIDSNMVATTDVYTYIGVIVKVINESLPRSAWLVIADGSTRTMNSRLNIAYTLIISTMTLGLLMTVIFLATSNSLAAAFVPKEVRQTSLDYVRLSSVQALTSATEAALSSSTRALDNPDVPLIISSSKFVINIMLDLLFISKFHVTTSSPTVVTQAVIRLACDSASALTGLVYFVFVVVKKRKANAGDTTSLKLSLSALMALVRPSVYTFSESAIRNAIYLWLVHDIIGLGQSYATAWGVFNTIRWGLVMVPVEAMEASTLAFVGHRWGQFRAVQVTDHPRASRKDIMKIIEPALKACCVALAFETVLCIAMAFGGIENFAYYLSASKEAAQICQTMWRAIDWTYLFYGLNYQLAAILLAASPRWYLYQAFGSNFLWMLPWAIFMTTHSVASSQAWTYYAIIFGGALVFDFFDVGFTLMVWIYRLHTGRIKIEDAREDETSRRSLENE